MIKGEKMVSIHAPAKGATLSRNNNIMRILRFQSTRPRRARPIITKRNRWFKCFNPRAREGRDVAAVCVCDGSAHVSIHAPAKGATFFIIRSNSN